MSAVVHDETRRTQKQRQLGLDGWVWVLVIATVPIQQLLYVLVSNEVRLLPIAAALMSLLLGRLALPRMQGILVGASALIIIGGLASGSNSSAGASVTVAITMAAFITLVPPAILFQMRRYPNFLRVALACALTVQTASAAAGIVQMTGQSVFGVIAREGRVNGLAYHPNVLGVMSVLAVLVLLELLRRRAAPRWILLASLLVNASALAATASLSSLLTLLVGLAFYAMRVATRYRVAAIVLLALGLVIALVATGGNLATLLPDALSDRVDQVTGVTDDGTASWLVRVETYKWSWDYITSDPLVGVGMDAMNQGTLTPSLVVHNFLLRGWYQGGVFVLIGFGLLVVVMVVQAFSGFRHTDYISPSAVIVSMLAFAMTSAFYTQSHYWLPVLIAFAFISEQLRGRIHSPDEKLRRSPQAAQTTRG
ncbi:O-antigen ligase family protein [Microbacterium sp. LMI12-1-1.1]|uniref:O-antigen ligase family protein n=1 Tax=Microbacterium sp. LMI12-1-1.1 TaxID=3135225 RepID=UPI003416F5C7